MLGILWQGAQGGGRIYKLQVLTGACTFGWQLPGTKPHSAFLWGPQSRVL